MAYLPMAVYGLEVPPGDMAISARPDIPAAFRITMAAIDPSAEPEGEGVERATLKIIRLPITADDYDDDMSDDEFDADEMEAMLAEEDDEEDSSEDEAGPSDPTKSKKARKAAAVEQIKTLLAEEGIDEGMSAKAKGKQRADFSEDEDMDEDEDDDSEGAEIEEYVICTLDTQKQYQQTLDIAIGEDERVWFKVSGTHSVFLTGNYIEPANYDDDDEDDYSDEDDSELDYDLEPDEDEIDELDDLDELSARITEVNDEEQEDIPVLVEDKKAKKNKKRAAEEDLDGMITKEKTKKQKKEPETNGSAKKVVFAKELEQGPTPSKEGGTSKSVSITTVQGVTLDDRTLGNGPQAKKGDRVGLRYIGKLKDGKVFDSNRKGKPFTFKLGAGEVIKGWDIGVAGMKVGGERRIIIPSHLAYGSKGAGADIPPNAQLTFDVKVLEINKGK